jgi:hypothetical protein
MVFITNSAYKIALAEFYKARVEEEKMEAEARELAEIAGRDMIKKEKEAMEVQPTPEETLEEYYVGRPQAHYVYLSDKRELNDSKNFANE